jgi:hypothetical protein
MRIQCPLNVEISSANIAVDEQGQILRVYVVLEILTINCGQVMIPIIVHL